jgi:hypothetical protein
LLGKYDRLSFNCNKKRRLHRKRLTNGWITNTLSSITMNRCRSSIPRADACIAIAAYDLALVFEAEEPCDEVEGEREINDDFDWLEVFDDKQPGRTILPCKMIGLLPSCFFGEGKSSP